MQVKPFKDIAKEIVAKRVKPTEPVMFTVDACDNSPVSGLAAIFKIDEYDKDLRPYGFIISLMFDLMNTIDKKDISWRVDPNITGSFESHFSYFAESQTLTSAQMAQDLENRLQRINFVIQGLTQQAWQDFLSYALKNDLSKQKEDWQETWYFQSEVLNYKYDFQTIEERRDGIRTLSLDKMKKIWEKVVTGECSRLFVAADKKNYF